MWAFLFLHRLTCQHTLLKFKLGKINFPFLYPNEKDYKWQNLKTKAKCKNILYCPISVYRSLILDKYLPRAYVPLLSNSHKYSIKQFKMSFGIGKGSKGIRQWPVKQCTSSMMIHKITHSVDFNKWLKRLSTQLNKPIKIQLESPRLLS